ncbi:MAG: DsbA family protein, partial [Amylibacter sp.]
MYNLVKATVIAALFAITPPALALDLDAMTDREKDLFGQQVREYLLQNPEVIMQVFSILEQRQQATELQEDTALVNAYLSEIQNDGFSWVGGNPDGDITLVEFLDYKCGYCR